MSSIRAYDHQVKAKQKTKARFPLRQDFSNSLKEALQLSKNDTECIII